MIKIITPYSINSGLLHFTIFVMRNQMIIEFTSYSYVYRGREVENNGYFENYLTLNSALHRVAYGKKYKLFGYSIRPGYNPKLMKIGCTTISKEEIQEVIDYLRENTPIRFKIWYHILHFLHIN